MPATKSRAVLVTGGAGYIGSHAILALRQRGHEVVVIDDLSTGWREAVPDGMAFYQGDVADAELISGLLRKHSISDVIHFAGSIQVEESVSDPLKYYRNNTCASRALIEICIKHGVGRFIFSSTAAAYGDAKTVPIREDAAIFPINPYGWSKVMTERILADVAQRHPLHVGILRYFNVAGADPEGRTGQHSDNATHLIKVACEAATGKRPGIQIFGTDYPTPDGTCIRDYIHVSDLVDAHVRVLDIIGDEHPFEILNCGYGRGYSVREVLRVVEEVLGRPLNATEAARRPGDPPSLVADSSRLRLITGWRPALDDLRTIVATAMAWERSLERAVPHDPGK